MKLTKEQKAYLKGIDSKKDRKWIKNQFILQNYFESIFGKGTSWFETTSKEVEDKFNELCKKYMPDPKEDITLKEFCVEITEENRVILEENEKQYTLEDMRKCFEQARMGKFPMGEFPYELANTKFLSFEQYLNSLK